MFTSLFFWVAIGQFGSLKTARVEFRLHSCVPERNVAEVVAGTRSAVAPRTFRVFHVGLMLISKGRSGPLAYHSEFRKGETTKFAWRTWFSMFSSSADSTCPGKTLGHAFTKVIVDRHRRDRLFLPNLFIYTGPCRISGPWKCISHLGLFTLSVLVARRSVKSTRAHAHRPRKTMIFVECKLMPCLNVNFA